MLVKLTCSELHLELYGACAHDGDEPTQVNHVREDDDLDVSDRGSDSDDNGATARRVLEECSALSKKLASVISSWASAEDEAGQAKGGGALKGVGSPRGAIEITQMREGKSVTTNEEISKACPGLVLNP